MDFLFKNVFNQERVFHSLVNEVTSNGLCITNLTLFIMVRTKLDLCNCNSSVIAEKETWKPFSSLGPTLG
jgi:hypothetical protein